MQSITLIIGILGSILVLSLRPVYALTAYFSVLVWYPDFLRVSIGTIDISVGRMLVTVLLLRCLFDDGIRKKFVWSRFDKLVGLSMVVYVGMYCATRPFLAAFENRGGFLTDTWFTYLSVRLILTDKQKLISFVKTIAVILAPLAILGVIEAVTGWQPYFPLRRFRPWNVPTGNITEMIRELRWGLFRAVGPFSHSIMFGGCFAMFLPLIWALRYQRDYWGKLVYPLCGILILGTLSSMSSGPWAMMIVVIFCLAMERYKRRTKTVLVWFVVLCILAGIVSNRPLYHVMYDYANVGGGDYWSRVRLIDAAMENVDQWWLAGYGGVDPGWGSREGGYFYGEFTDVNNEFILAGIEYGILGIIALCAVLAMAFSGLIRANSQTQDTYLKSLYWSMGSALVGLVFMIQGVSLFGQNSALFYFLLGTLGASSVFPKCVTVGSGILLRSSNGDLIYRTRVP